MKKTILIVIGILLALLAIGYIASPSARDSMQQGFEQGSQR